MSLKHMIEESIKRSVDLGPPVTGQKCADWKEGALVKVVGKKSLYSGSVGQVKEVGWQFVTVQIEDDIVAYLPAQLVKE